MNAQVMSFAIPPVVKRVTVQLSPERAFHRFTTEICRWWPLGTHSLGQGEAATVAFEPHVGGRLFETARDGSEQVWGTVTCWEPPHALAFTWHVGREPSAAQLVELSFAAAGDHTLVTLTHSGWEVLGAEAQANRDGYDTGCEGVFCGAYAAL